MNAYRPGRTLVPLEADLIIWSRRGAGKGRVGNIDHALQGVFDSYDPIRRLIVIKFQQVSIPVPDPADEPVVYAVARAVGEQQDSRRKEVFTGIRGAGIPD